MTKDFDKFQKFTNSYEIKSHDTEVYITQTYKRTICNDYQEAVFRIKKSYRYYLGIYNSCESNIKIVLSNNKIIYYDMINKDIHNIKDSPMAHIYKVYHYCDSNKYENLKVEFKNIYGNSLNQNDLFVDSIYFGLKCGHGGERTNEMTQIQNWSKAFNRSELFNWLCSPNIEKQVYALQGYKFMTDLGYKLTTEEKNILQVILAKTGTMLTCIQCDAGQTEINKVVKGLQFP